MCTAVIVVSNDVTASVRGAHCRHIWGKSIARCVVVTAVTTSASMLHPFSDLVESRTGTTAGFTALN